MSHRDHDGLSRPLRRLGREIQALRDAVLIIDAEGYVAEANPAAAEIFAASTLELQARHVQELIHLDGHWTASGPTAEVLADARPLMLNARRINGDDFPAEVTMSEYGVGEERGAATVAVVRDLSDRQRIMQVAAHRERLAAVGEVTAQIMHGLNSPLTGITTLVQELLETCGDGERELLQLVKGEAERAGAMVHELLYFTRRDVSIPEVDLNEIVRRAIELFKLRHRCAQGHMTAELHEEPARVRGQPTQIEQVVLNLLDNACHALQDQEEPQIDVRTRIEGERIILQVSDNGAGVPAEIQERVFEPFFTTKEPGVGTGLGLAIVESIVRECGGSITLESQPGRGATFTVAFQPAR